MNAAEWLRDRADTYRADAASIAGIVEDAHWHKVYSLAVTQLTMLADAFADGTGTVEDAVAVFSIVTAELRDAARLEREQAAT